VTNPCHGLGLEPKGAAEEWTLTTRVETRLQLAPITAIKQLKHSVISYLNSSHHKIRYFESYRVSCTLEEIDRAKNTVK